MFKKTRKISLILILIMSTILLGINKNSNKYNKNTLSSSSAKLEFYLEFMNEIEEEIVIEDRNQFLEAIYKTEGLDDWVEYDAIKVALKARSLTNNEVPIDGIGIDIHVPSFILDNDYPESRPIDPTTPKRGSVWVPTLDKVESDNKKYIFGADLDTKYLNISKKDNDYATPEGVIIAHFNFSVDLGNIPEDFAFELFYDSVLPSTNDVTYLDEDVTVQYKPEELVFKSLQVGDPNSGPNAYLKSIDIQGETENYNNHITLVGDDSDLEQEITISYADSKDGNLTITAEAVKGTNEIEYIGIKTDYENGDKVTIKVTDSSDSPALIKEYVITINVTLPDDNTKVIFESTPSSPGKILEEGFENDTSNVYNIRVDFATNNVDVKVILESLLSTVDHNLLKFIDLQPGVMQTKQIAVTPEKGKVNNYTINVTRDSGNDNKDFKVNVNGDTVLKEDDKYSALILETTDRFTITFIDLQSTTKLYYRDNKSTSENPSDYTAYSGTHLLNILLDKGMSKEYTILAIAQDGSKELSTIIVKRAESTNTDLKSVVITENDGSQTNNPTLTPVNNVYTYNIIFSDTGRVTFGITGKDNEFADIKVYKDNVHVTEVQTKDLKVGANEFSIRVIAQAGGEPTEYKLIINKLSNDKEVTGLTLLNNDNQAEIANLSQFTYKSTTRTYTYEMDFEVGSKFKLILETSDGSKITHSGTKGNNRLEKLFTFIEYSIQKEEYKNIEIEAENGTKADAISIIITRKAADTDNNLVSVDVNGKQIDPFSSTTKNYRVILDRTILDVNVEGFLSDSSKATVEFYIGDIKQNTTGKAVNLTLEVNKEITLEIRVISQANKANSYYIKLIAAAVGNEITNIKITEIPSYVFNKTEASINLSVPYSIDRVTFNISHSEFSKLTTGLDANSSISLNVSTPTTITIFATSEAGTKGTEYKIIITRQSGRDFKNLASLSITPEGKESQDLDISQTNHNLTFNRSVSKFTVEATIKGDKGEKFRDTTILTFSIERTLQGAQNTDTIEIVVLDEMGISKTYTIKITLKDDVNTFKEIKIDSETYSAADFIDGVLTIEKEYDFNHGAIDFIITLFNEYGKLNYTFSAGASLDLANKLTFKQGKTTIKFWVKAENGQDGTTYEVIINKKVASEIAELETLSVTYGNGTNHLLEFKSGETITLENTYNIIRDFNTIAISSTAKDNGTITGNTLSTSLDPGKEKSFVIKVTSENGANTRDYTIRITNMNTDNKITGMEVDGKDISFIATEHEYTITETYKYNVSSITVDVAMDDIFATINNKERSVRQFVFDLKYGENKFYIQASSELGVAGIKYTIIVNVEHPYEDINLKTLEAFNSNGDSLDFEEGLYKEGEYTYTIKLEGTDTLDKVRVDFTKKDEKQTVVDLVNGQVFIITTLPNGTINYTITFKVEAENKKTQTYNIRIIKGDVIKDTSNILDELKVTADGTKVILGLNPEDGFLTFNPTTNTYNITLNESYEKIMIQYTRNHPGQTISGRVLEDITLTHGLNQFKIVVTPEDTDKVKNTYTINITIKNSEIEVSSLSVDNLLDGASFEQGKETYDLGKVDGRTKSITINSTIPTDSFGTLTGNGTFTLNEGLNSFPVNAVSEDGTKTITYYITIILEYNSDTSIVEGILKDQDNKTVFEYENGIFSNEKITVSSNVTRVTLDIETTYELAELEGSKTVQLAYGENTIKFRIKAENGDYSDYYEIIIVREQQSNDATLKHVTITDMDGEVILGLSGESPKYEFDSNTIHYEIKLDRSYELVNFDFALNDVNAIIIASVVGDHSLTGGQTTRFNYSIRSQDGSKTMNYTINITVKNSTIGLDGDLSVDNYPFDTDFDKDVLEYNIGLIPADVARVMVRAKLNDTFGKITGSGNVAVYQGVNFLEVTLTSEDESKTITYIINYEKESSGGSQPVSSDNELFDLRIEGTKDPINLGFDKDTWDYPNILLDYSDAQFFIRTSTNARATVKGDGLHSIAEGETKTITVQVTAEDGTKGLEYTITVTRPKASDDNELSELWIIVNGTKIDLDITKGSFIQTVDPTTTSVEIGAVAPKGAKVHGLGIKDLVDSISIYTVTVISESGEIKTYNIQIQKVNDDATLIELEVSNYENGDILEFTTEFKSDQLNYFISLGDNKISEIEINAIATDAKNAIIVGHGVKNLKSGIGETTDRFDIVVTAQDGTTRITYTITIERNIDPDDSITINDLFLVGNSITYLGNDKHPSALNKFVATKFVYDITVPFSLNSVALTVSNIDGAIITGTGNHMLNDTTTVIEFTIKSKSGKVSQTYTINITKEPASENALLDSISVNGNIIEGFKSDQFTYEYIVDVDKVKEINLSAKLQDEFSILSGHLGVLTINPGRNIFKITVKAENGDTQTYDVIFDSLSFDNTLKSLEVLDKDLTPVFDAEVYSYFLTIPYTEDSLEIEAIANHDKAVVFGAGVKIKIPVGVTTYSVYAKSEAGFEGTKYNVVITRQNANNDTTLSKLEFYDRNGGNLINFTASFDPVNRDYIINLPEGTNIMSAFIVAEATAKTSTVFNDGNQLLGGFVDGDYHTILTISVQAEDGSIGNYKISVYRNVDLSSINDITSLELLGNDNKFYFDFNDFNKDKLSYNVEVPFSVDSLNLIIDTVGNAVGVGIKQFFNNNTLVFEFYVVSQNGTKGNTYTITVTREEALTNNTLDSLTVNDVMVPNFDPAVNSYELTIPTRSSKDITIGATASADAIITGTGNKVLLNGKNVFTVSVRAQNGVLNTYTITINYVDSNALLDKLFVYGSVEDRFDEENSKEYTNFTFDPETFEYVIIVDVNTTFVRVTGAAQDQLGARVSGFGAYKIGNDEERIRIFVESADGLITETYTIRISKVSIPDSNADLKDLSVGGRDIKFTSNNYNYRIDVSKDTKYIEISAETFNPNGKIYIEGYEMNGNNKISISVDDIEVGKNTLIIKVVAEDGITTQYYQLIVTQEAAPNMMLLVLLILSLLLWIITVLILLIKGSRNRQDNKDDVIF